MHSTAPSEKGPAAAVPQATLVTPGPLRVGSLELNVIVVPERRAVRLTVERDARITATVPAGLDQARLVDMVRSRRAWLYDKLEDRTAHAAARPCKEFVTGEGFHYLGRSYRLKLVDDTPFSVRLVQGRLQLRRDRQDQAQECLIAWYRSRGRAWLPGRAAPWAERMRAPMETIAVRKLGYRWGSCNRDGGVNIHWATMQLPAILVDYVLVHELAHLHHRDHSEAFWRTVERAMPDYEERRFRLERTGAALWLPDTGSTDW